MSWKDRPFSLSRLRDIAFRHWDPIGILSPSESWESHPAADEYDAYLLEAASLLRMGEPASVVAQRLIEIHSDHMGIAVGMADRHKAAETAAAIEAYVAELDDT